VLTRIVHRPRCRFDHSVGPLTYDDIAQAATAVNLTALGGFHEDGATTILLGPREPGFWDHVSVHPAFTGDEPLDNWSDATITGLADQLSATPLFPFGGPPYNAFISWALKSGETWQSPVGLLVHKDAGLLVSYRGALRFGHHIDLPIPVTSPCDTCADKPCLTARQWAQLALMDTMCPHARPTSPRTLFAARAAVCACPAQSASPTGAPPPRPRFTWRLLSENDQTIDPDPPREI
jgi:hypothetical protein